MFQPSLEDCLPTLLEEILLTTDPKHEAVEDPTGDHDDTYGAATLYKGTPVVFINTSLARTKRKIEETFTHEIFHIFYWTAFEDQSYQNETNVRGESLDFLERNRDLVIEAIYQFENLSAAYEDAL